MTGSRLLARSALMKSSAFLSAAGCSLLAFAPSNGLNHF